MKKILLTAFESFNGETINPSLEVAERIACKEFTESSLEILRLPVARFEAIDITLETIEHVQPDIVMMLGEAGGRSTVSPERVAINLEEYHIPDNTGCQPRGESIVHAGPVGYFSTLPVNAIATAINNLDIPASVSNSAGLYLCNRLFYSVMHFVSVNNLEINAGFIHLPYLPEQITDKNPGCPCLPVDVMEQAIAVAIDIALTDSGG